MGRRPAALCLLVLTPEHGALQTPFWQYPCEGVLSGFGVICTSETQSHSAHHLLLNSFSEVGLLSPLHNQQQTRLYYQILSALRPPPAWLQRAALDLWQVCQRSCCSVRKYCSWPYPLDGCNWHECNWQE